MRWAVPMLALLAAACGPAEPEPDRGALRQPTGLALTPDGTALLVTNGNWDRREAGGTLASIDLVALDAALSGAGGPGSSRTCRAVSADDHTLECDPSAFIDPERTVVLGDGVGNIAIDRPGGDDGPTRLLVSTRVPAAVYWMDLAGASVQCGQDDEGHCDDDHQISRSPSNPDVTLPGEPARVVVGDTQRFAYVPHLLGGALSLIRLDGDDGPELADVQTDFFHADVFDDEDLAGGLSVAELACDPEMPSEDSRDCTRPTLYASHRYFPGLRQFSVAPGLDRILPGVEVTVATLNVAAVTGRPFMADLHFADDSGDTLLAVQSTPPGLLRVNTSLDEYARPVNEVIGTLPLCADPNAMTVYQPADGEALALVACRGAGAIAVVGLASFRVLRLVAVGAGPSEIAVDSGRARAYVANTEEHTISIVGLSPRQPAYLRELARVGLGAGSRDDAAL